MKSTILATEALQYTAEVRELAAVPGSFNLTVSSIWPGAKDPTAERALVQLTLDVGGLVALRDLIANVLQGREGIDAISAGIQHQAETSPELVAKQPMRLGNLKQS